MVDEAHPATQRGESEQADESASVLAAPLHPRDVVLNLYTSAWYQKIVSLNYGETRDRIAKRDDPKNRYRWNVTLECGCMTEALTYGREHPPTDGWHRGLDLGARTGDAKKLVFVVNAGWHTHDEDITEEPPSEREFEHQGRKTVIGGFWGKPPKYLDTTYPGILWCAAHDDEPPLREIVRWVKFEERVSKKGNQYLAWKVVLSCGHVHGHAISDIDWRPEHGLKPDLKMTNDVTEYLRKAEAKGKDTASIRSWYARYMTTTGEWMEPQTHDDCWQCKCHRRIVSFEPVGPLTWKGDTLLTTEQAQQRRLQAVERRADELREQLARVEAEEEQLRGALAGTT